MLREKLEIVAPVYNEEEVLPETLNRFNLLRQNLAVKNVDVSFIFVDDGSNDSTLKILRNASINQSHLKVLSLSRNFGHQFALTAGLDHADADYIVIIDADLQDPPELIPDMLNLARKGYQNVYGKRRSRQSETWFKKFTASLFYQFLSYMSDTKIPANTGDFRLITKSVHKAFCSMRERHRFIRGMIPWIGFKTVAFHYDREKRFAGKTKFPFSKMFAFANNAIFSFSTKPILLATRLGLVTISLGFVGSFYILYLKIFTDIPVPGLTATLTSLSIFSGIQILLIGMIGSYVARIFEENKGRPLYIVNESHNVRLVVE
jgi:glycosyltransferase involved in cell wall biosynthesis